MDPVGAASSVIALIQLAGKASTAAISFVRDVNGARADMRSLRKELSKLKTTLELIQKDIKMEPPRAGSMFKMHAQIDAISRNCLQVVTQICQIIDNCRSRVWSKFASLKWVAMGKGKVNKLKEDLHVHTSFLQISLTMMSYSGMKDIKQDTTASRQGVTELIDKVDQILIMISSGSGLLRGRYASTAMLAPYLKGLKGDAETILDSIDYQQEEEEEEEERTLGQGEHDDEKWRTLPSSEALPVTFTNSQGRCFCIPFEACKTWAQMANIVQGSFSNTDQNENLRKEKYDLKSDGTIYSPSLWDMLIKPGLKIEMVMWKETAPQRAVESTTTCSRSLPETQTRPELQQNPELSILKDSDSEILRFRDAVGRSYVLIWRLVKSWEGMEDLINQEFEFAGTMRDQVLAGCYTLRINETGEAIPKDRWASVVQPGMSISMTMCSDTIQPLHVVVPKSWPPGLLPGETNDEQIWPVISPREKGLNPILRVTASTLRRHHNPRKVHIDHRVYEPAKYQGMPLRSQPECPFYKTKSADNSGSTSSKTTDAKLSSWNILGYM
ncbi:hypothetical protein BD289DRAFT_167390 [Coniella lustricola]|uniref:Uncharacterized protein n=1 Tax=Coniella lustricola TaxID=2025994 RepID=A0A2T3AE97_9PEZI|nr:hypothetical protein BD289DRAFT_167390 [Coniella lustricola]